MTATPEFVPADVLDERKAFEAVKGLVIAERDGEVGVLRIGPYTAYIMVSSMQLSCRHPGLGGELKRALRQVGDSLIAMLAQGGHVRAAQHAMLGWDPSHDVGTDHACVVEGPECAFHGPGLLCPACAG